MSLAQLKADVMTIVKRPDLDAMVELHVRMATLKCHQSDYYPRDIVNVNYNTGALGTFKTVALANASTNFRAFNYIQKSEATRDDSRAYDMFDIIDANNLFDEYNQYKTNITYVAGSNVILRSSEDVQYIYFSSYVNPDVTPGNFSSWIDAVQPYVIICEAARTVFSSIGYQEMSALYERLTMEQLMLLKQNNIRVAGY